MDTTMPNTQVSLGFATAFTVTVCGGVLLAVSAVLPLPVAVPVVGLALFVAGTLLITGLAVAVSRATGKSVARSAWSGVRIAFAWLWFFMP